MDPTSTSAVVNSAAVPTAGIGLRQLLLSGGAGVSGESGLLALAGRGIHSASVLRGAQNDLPIAAGGPSGGTQAGASFAADDGVDGGVSEAPFELPSAGSPAFSLPAQGPGDRAAQSGLEHRHHLHPAAGRIRLPGGGPRLVQPLRVGLGTVDQLGNGFLCGRFGAGADRNATSFS